MHNML